MPVLCFFVQVSSLDRNRASPAPVIKLCRSLTPEQRDAVIDMVKVQGCRLDGGVNRRFKTFTSGLTNAE
jgi:hypothetical protein